LNTVRPIRQKFSVLNSKRKSTGRDLLGFGDHRHRSLDLP
jgi:hypothetical protein